MALSTRFLLLSSVAFLALLPSSSMAFVSGGVNNLASAQLRPMLRRSQVGSVRMGMEQVEFIIHKDGRVEEKVTGIKGKECHEVTAEIEKLLGKVTYTQPTAEQFEEKITITTKEESVQGQGNWGSSDGSSGWSKY